MGMTMLRSSMYFVCGARCPVLGWCQVPGLAAECLVLCSLQGFSALCPLPQQVGRQAYRQQRDQPERNRTPIRRDVFDGAVAVPHGQQPLSEIANAAANHEGNDEALHAD